MPNENRIDLTVVTTSGTVPGTYNIHQHLQQVVDHVFHELNIHPTEKEQWELTYEGVVLSLSQTIEQAHLPNGARLTLAQKEGGGGDSWTRK